jgi:hypothetical protein
MGGVRNGDVCLEYELGARVSLVTVSRNEGFPHNGEAEVYGALM